MTIFTLGMVLLVSLEGSLAISVAPPPLNNEFLQECEVKIAICGLEGLNGILKNATVSVKCCHKLVYMGKSCHDRLVTHLISQPFFKGDKNQILASAQRTWNYCVSVPF